MTAARAQTMTDQPKPTTKRILAFDILRGYFILLIASVHLHYYPSLLGLFDGRGQLWTSEAEGFFFISGLLIGIIRRRDITQRGFIAAADKLWRRSGRLYIVSIILSIIYVLLARTADFNGIQGAKDGLNLISDFWPLMLDILSMHYSYGWADFLNYYVVFLFISPFLLWLLARRMWILVLGLVTFGWVLRWSGDWGWYNPLLQWQVFFFMGAVIGFYWPQLESAFRRLPERRRSGIKTAAVILSTIIYVVGMVMVFVPQHFSAVASSGGIWGQVASTIRDASNNQAYVLMLVDGRLGLLRPIIWLIVFAGMYVVVRRFESHILHWIGWLLVPYGANSLYAYIIESMLLFAIPFVLRPSGFWVNAMIEIFIVGTVWIAIRRRFMYGVIPR